MNLISGIETKLVRIWAIFLNNLLLGFKSSGFINKRLNGFQICLRRNYLRGYCSNTQWFEIFKTDLYLLIIGWSLTLVRPRSSFILER